MNTRNVPVKTEDSSVAAAAPNTATCERKDDSRHSLGYILNAPSSEDQSLLLLLQDYQEKSKVSFLLNQDAVANTDDSPEMPPGSSFKERGPLPAASVPSFQRHSPVPLIQEFQTSDSEHPAKAQSYQDITKQRLIHLSQQRETILQRLRERKRLRQGQSAPADTLVDKEEDAAACRAESTGKNQQQKWISFHGTQTSSKEAKINGEVKCRKKKTGKRKPRAKRNVCAFHYVSITERGHMKVVREGC